MTKRINNLITAMMGPLNATGHVWAVVGLIVLVVAAAMSWSFGSEVSWKHAAFLACLTFVAAFGPDAAHRAWHDNKRIASVVIALVCVPLLAIEFYTHAGFTAGLRGHNIETTSVQNVRYDQRQDAVKEGRTNLGFWEKRLAELEAANGWVATVTAEALRAQLASANLAIEQEAARGGCKAKCLERTKERDGLAAKIAIAEEKADLTKKIEGVRKVLSTARETAAVTEHKSSPVVHQNQFLGRAVSLVGFGSLEPTPHIQAAAEQSANLAMAIAGTGLPAFCLFVAGLYRRKDDDHTATLGTGDPSVRPSANASPALSVSTIAGTQTAPHHDTVTHRILGAHALKEWAKSPEVRKLLAA